MDSNLIEEFFQILRFCEPPEHQPDLSKRYTPYEIDYEYPNWLLSDALGKGDKVSSAAFPHSVPHTREDSRKLSAKAAGLWFVKKYGYLSGSIVEPMGSAIAWFGWAKLQTTNLRDRGLTQAIARPHELMEILTYLYSGFNVPVGLVSLALMCKLAWFRTGHHLGGTRIDASIIVFATKFFEVDLTSTCLEEFLKSLWHFAHHLDSRAACAALGLVPHYNATRELIQGLASVEATDEGDTMLFPVGTTILLKGDRVFAKLASTRFAKYFKDKDGTVGRLTDSFNQVSNDRAAFHPDAEYLGKKYRQINISNRDKRIISAIAYIVFDPEQLEDWRDIQPQDQVLKEPVYMHLRHVQEKLRFNKESELKPCDKPFKYERLCKADARLDDTWSSDK